ncbi:hypothetical protein D6D19_01986 [Aureobasidium pullulans]|uniref:RNA helicase n=1 Tax=Aureobasidium pullulans TaxID=5580 RepID=A0A4S9AEC1_AURPU|nr:hypothetical protein D6D19_01986 [Aureobasidium pullulans]
MTCIMVDIRARSQHPLFAPRSKAISNMPTPAMQTHLTPENIMRSPLRDDNHGLKRRAFPAMNPYTNKPYSANYPVLVRQTQGYPVTAAIPSLLQTLRDNRVMVVVGETGSGKTTILPKEILGASMTALKIGVTQNRRLATSLTGERIADLVDVIPGTIVGLRFRGRNLTSRGTLLEVVTDGLLLALAMSDPNLSEYGVIVIDEAHQHTVATDLLLGLLKELLHTRTDLKVVIMSATIDSGMFTDYFPGSVLRTVGGRQHDVHVHYLKETPVDVVGAIVTTVLQIHLTERGDLDVDGHDQDHRLKPFARTNYKSRLATTKSPSQSPQNHTLLQDPHSNNDELAQVRAQLADRDRQLDQLKHQLLRGSSPSSSRRPELSSGSPCNDQNCRPSPSPHLYSHCKQ